MTFRVSYSSQSILVPPFCQIIFPITTVLIRSTGPPWIQADWRTHMVSKMEISAPVSDRAIMRSRPYTVVVRVASFWKVLCTTDTCSQLCLPGARSVTDFKKQFSALVFETQAPLCAILSTPPHCWYEAVYFKNVLLMNTRQREHPRKHLERREAD